MKRFSRMLIAAMALVLLAISCRPLISEYHPEDYSLAPNPGEYNFSAIFQGYWSAMNRNYVFWDIDSTDWDAVYDEYKPKFEALGVFKSAEIGTPKFQSSVGMAYSYFKEMSKDISDGHFRIDFDPALIDILKDHEDYAAYPPTGAPMVRFTLDRLRDRPGFVERDTLFINNNWKSFDSSKLDETKDGQHTYSFDYFNNIIANEYLENISVKSAIVPMMIPNHPVGAGGWPAFESNLRIGTGRISYPGGGYILYLHFSNFGLAVVKNGLIDGLGGYPGVGQALNEFKAAIEQFLDDLSKDDIKGVIVDLRGNYGGDYSDWDILWKRMIDSPLRFADVRTKSGLGRLDHGPWTPFVLDPHTGPDSRVLQDKSVPVVALVDKFTGSAAELSTLIVKAMPNGHVIGERTMGAISPMGGDNRVFNGGRFNGGKFWTSVTCAFLEVQDLDGHINEKIGIPPDQEVSSDWDKFLGGASEPDVRLNAAIDYIKAH